MRWGWGTCFRHGATENFAEATGHGGASAEERGEVAGPHRWARCPELSGALSKAVDGCATEGENRGDGGELTGAKWAGDQGSGKWSWGLIKARTRGQNGAMGSPCACAHAEELPAVGTYVYVQRAVAGEATRRVAERQGEVERALQRQIRSADGASSGTHAGAYTRAMGELGA
jgi:hypothetical protein